MATEHAATVPGAPEDRYGSRRPRRPRRWRYWAFTAAALVFACSVAYVGYQNIGTAPLEAERIGFTGLNEHAMRITFTVTRDNPDKPVVCVVRVLDDKRAESGRREVFVPPAENGSPIRATIRSDNRPITAEVFGCAYQVPPYLDPDRS